MADKSPSGVHVASTTEVLLAEYRHFWPKDAQPATRLDYYRAARGKGQAALCLSGGGIRSAAFALGVLQALSTKGLLTGFHYLSTVSGGGYIGGWLQRWIYDRQSDATEVMKALANVQEAPEVSALRENSNFITPRVGIGSNDTWTAIAISGRNVTLNWLLFGPLLVLAASIPNLFLASVESVPRRSVNVHWIEPVLLGLSVLFAMLAAWNVVRELPSYRAAAAVAPGKADGWLTSRIVFPLVAWSVTGTLALSIDLDPTREPWVVNGFALALASLVASLFGLLVSGLMIPHSQGEDPQPEGRPAPPSAYRGTFFVDLSVWAVSLGLAALSVILGARLLEAAEVRLPEGLPFAALLAVMGPLWLMGTQLLVAIVFAGFRHASGKTVRPDADREWLARLSAVKIKPMLLWAVIGSAVLILNALLSHYMRNSDMSLTGLIALATGAGAVSGGKSDKSGDTGGKAKGFAGSILKLLPMSALIALCTFLFIIALFVILGRGEEIAAVWLAAIIEPFNLPEAMDEQVVAHFAIIALMVVLLAFFRTRIQVNRFSLNGFYRNRLARAFLGGARRKRRPDPFTGLDAADNVRLYHLTPVAGAAAVLYPVVNIALNVTKSEKLAWQERKAESFVFSPKFSGSAMLTPCDSKTGELTPQSEPGTAAAPLPGETAPRVPGERLGEPSGAFIASDVYGGNEPDLAMGGSGVSLATAISISGAAASPNMGYHTSPATAFLMTLFNVRLGAWLPNPAQAEKLGEDIKRSGPNDSLRAILRELAGATDDRGRDIYLSDGGHFENLGLYEMVRRRCKYVMVSDAGADPDCSFEDLGNAVRKIKIDLDIDIAFEELRISSRNNPIHPQYAYAIGTIEYPEARYSGAEPETAEARRDRIGHLLYVKPSYFGELPVDVRSYAAKSPTFPHESTADQFYSESQFESYRRLGYFFTEALGRKGGDPTSIPAFFAAIEAEHREEKAKEQPLDEEGLVGRFRKWLRV
ncbi:MAG: patatin-like phospholipase family protein [Allosphingosinicella sp.]